ncbi:MULTISPECIES: SDR family oxidoreductase [unclassified Sphingomonas]|uniref:SDR family oxidoreductase n=1 Tax=unclassified Sphingomonas TaxID=196159 RepID=UPI000BCE9CD5|nr:MAG: short-chain dehydrogenase [Sphingomonas sp. 12-62-6]OYX40006.1 MAG: short-chain dehydrogenase [Sphingomonas sp. 32-62-10]
MDLHGKTVLVTGGTDGIGLALARALRVKGAQVIICGRDPARLAAAHAEGLEAIDADLTTDAGRDKIVDVVRQWPIDILVNNAGMGTLYDVTKGIDLDRVDQCIALNLTTPIHLITRLMDGLRARSQAMIVNVTSGLAIAPSKGAPVYCATKAGLRSFTQALRAQLAGSNIQVMEVLPPVVETRMTAGQSHKKMPVEECARQIVAAMETDRHEANVGMTKLLSVVHNISPAIARRVMLRF